MSCLHSNLPLSRLLTWDTQVSIVCAVQHLNICWYLTTHMHCHTYLYRDHRFFLHWLCSLWPHRLQSSHSWGAVHWEDYLLARTLLHCTNGTSQTTTDYTEWWEEESVASRQLWHCVLNAPQDDWLALVLKWHECKLTTKYCCLDVSWFPHFL